MKKIVFKILLLLLISVVLVSCSKSKEAQAVDDMITAIGEVSIESEAAILDAEAAYNTLSAKDKENVSSYETLLDARNTYDKLRAADNELKATEINSELKEMIKKETITQKEADEINIKIEELPKEVYDLVDAQLIKKATELRPVEKSAIVAVNSVMVTLKNESSLHLYEVGVKEGIGPDGEDLVSVSFSAANSVGANIDGTECVDVNTKDWTTEVFDYITIYSYLGGNTSEVSSLKNSMTMLYVISDEEAILVDTDRIMNNLDAVKK